MARKLETQDGIIDQLHKLKDKTVVVYVPIGANSELALLGKLQRTTDETAWRVLSHGNKDEATAVLFPSADVKMMVEPVDDTKSWQIQLRNPFKTVVPTSEFK